MTGRATPKSLWVNPAFALPSVRKTLDLAVCLLPSGRGQSRGWWSCSVRGWARTQALLDRRLVVSDTPQGPLRFGLPLHALRFYFPALWPEAEADDGDSGAVTLAGK